MKKLLVLGLCILIVLGFSGCVSQPKEEKIKIVTSFPMRSMQAGQDLVNSITLALEENNYTAAGYKIELVVEDDGDENGKWQTSIEEDIARRASADPDVMVYIGTYNSGAAKVSIPITNRAGLVQISPVNTWPGLTKPGFLPGEPGIFYPTGMRTFFRVCPGDDLQGSAGAVWAKELGFDTVYIFDDGEAYGKGIADLFEQKARELGITVIGHKILDKTSQNFTNELSLLKDTNPDIIYFGGTTVNGAIPLVKGMKETGLSAKFMAPDGVIEQLFLDGAGSAAEGAYLTVVGIPPSALTGTGRNFVDNYKTRFGAEPGTVSPLGYETAKVVLLGIERARVKDRSKILNEISKIKDYNGILGTWSFDKHGDTTLDIISGNVVENSNFVFVKLLATK